MKNNKIFYGKQHINITDKDFVNKALYSDLISSGDYVKNFEKKISLMCKSKYSLVCNSGTSALYLAFYSIGLKKNDVVLMPSINFISSYSMCKNFGAKIYLTDVYQFCWFRVYQWHISVNHNVFGLCHQEAPK